jgi:hypothetical protein
VSVLSKKKYRFIGIFQPMSDALTSKGGRAMELFIPLAILAAWIVIQTLVLPRFGVST